MRALSSQVVCGALTRPIASRPCGLDQPIDRVVDVIVVGSDDLVGEEDGFLRAVLDMGDVADGIVGCSSAPAKSRSSELRVVVSDVSRNV